MTDTQKLKAYNETLELLINTEQALLDIEKNGDLSERGCVRLNWTREVIRHLKSETGDTLC